MDREKLHIGQKLTFPAKDILKWVGEEGMMKQVKVGRDKEVTLFVRELHNSQVAGLSYSMDTPAERSMGILYTAIPEQKK